MGPTAAGKTPLAVEIVKRLHCEIISVDSALIYRGMDIGTAKPSPDVLKIAPHRLINFLDPSEHYSAGQFRKDALHEIEDIIAHHHIPLLVGGTMMYFRALQKGLATLPPRDTKLRAALSGRAEREGWEVLHQALATVDPEAGKRIYPRDTQRIQRALEVFMLTGKTISEWQSQDTSPLSKYRVINIAITPSDRAILHTRIAQRFEQMLKEGFVEEVRHLYERGDLTPDLPSIRSVGYRQAWDYLSGKVSYEEMCEKAVAATRQLAKRQLTWLRSWPELKWYDSADETLFAKVILDLKQAVVQ
jgi:tRNA dimethylallyltransferase